MKLLLCIISSRHHYQYEKKEEEKAIANNIIDSLNWYYAYTKVWFNCLINHDFKDNTNASIFMNHNDIKKFPEYFFF